MAPLLPLPLPPAGEGRGEGGGRQASQPASSAGAIVRFLAIAACVASVAASRAAPVADPPSDAALPARVIVAYRDGSAWTQKQALTAAGKRQLQTADLAGRVGVPLVAGRGIDERTHVVLAPGIGAAALAERLAGVDGVAWAVVDGRKHISAAPNDPYYATRPITGASGGPQAGQWFLKPPSAETPAAIDAERAWDATTGSSAVVVAVLDSGVRFDHPDLGAGNVLPGHDLISADDAVGAAGGSDFSTAHDGDGRDADAGDPGDAITTADKANPRFAGSDCPVAASSWHGTRTLGLVAAATNNGTGVAGVGHGNVRALPVRVLGRCGGYDSDILAGIRWAAGLAVPDLPANATPARVLNLSLGGAGPCTAPYAEAIAAVTAAGSLVVASAGNSAGHAVASPANCPGALAVAGLRHAGSKVGFSDLGPEIGIGAPGGNCVNSAGACLYPIVTTSNAGSVAPVAGAAGGPYSDAFSTSLGTSFSAPLVAGAAALVLSARPSLTPAQVRQALQSTARPFPAVAGVAACAAPGSADQLECNCTATTCGAGMLDVRAAVAAAAGVQAQIAVSTAQPVEGRPVVLASTSVAGGGAAIASYRWSVADAGTTGAAISGAADGPSVTVLPNAPGTFVASLAVTDALGVVSTATVSVVVSAGSTPPADGGSDDGGGGGAAGAFGLAGVALAALGLGRRGRRLQRAPVQARKG